MKELKFRSRNILLGLIVSYALFTFCRIIFWSFNQAYFTHNTNTELFYAFFYGLWFDTVPVFYYNLLFILFYIVPTPRWNTKGWRQASIIIFLITNGLATFQNLSDVAYFPFIKKRTGAEILQLAQEWDWHQLVSYFTDFWYLLLIFFTVMLCCSLILSKLLLNQAGTHIPTSRSNTLVSWLVFLVLWIGVVILGLRGGGGLIPLRTFDAGKYVPTGLVPLTINTPFQLICTIEGKEAPTFNFMPNSKAREIIKPIKTGASGTPSKKNVVIIIVESLGKEYMGFYNQGQGYTPFLDSLCDHALTFEHSYANGTTSMDAPPALFSGLPNLMEDSYIVSRYNTNTPSSIGKLLTSIGYECSFYHGGKNGTMGFDNFISLSGMGAYKGLTEYPNKEDFDGKWGIFDKPYLEYYANELSHHQEPFLSAVFTLSSHHPYTVPEPYVKTLPKGSLPIHQSILYTDLSLKSFFQKAKKSNWYQNTVFIITADHTSDSEKPLYQIPLGRYAIPFILYDPTQGKKSIKKNVMQQSLLLPMLMDYLNFPKPYFSLGASPLSNPTFGVFYMNGSYVLVQDEFTLHMSPSKTTLHKQAIDPFFTQDISDQYPTIKQNLELLLQAYLQLYVEGLKENAFGLE